MDQRVQKIMAHAGIASRRKCEELIAQGKVKVNGVKIRLGDTADPERDVIQYDGKILVPEKKVYFILNKPIGYVTSLQEKGKKTIAELIKIPEKVFPVGRLDENAEGLIILTNDGELANRIAHPRYMTYKTYQVELDRQFTGFKKLKTGVFVEGRLVKIKAFKQIKKGMEVTIHEGRKHVVKKIFHALGYKVQNLKRVKVANINIGSLRPGQIRPITKSELYKLRQVLHMS